MANHNLHEPQPDLQHSLVLRDKILECLPAIALTALNGAEVCFWPSEQGDMELRILFNPRNTMLEVEATEDIFYTEDYFFAGSHIRTCKINAINAKVEDYNEFMSSAGDVNKPIEAELAETERMFHRFDQDKEDFFLGLLSSL